MLGKRPNRVTRKMINDALRARGRDESLYPGKGYFYFGGGDAVRWLSSSVMMKHLSDLTLERWLAELNKLLNREKTLRRQMAFAVDKKLKPTQRRVKTRQRLTDWLP